MARDYRIYQIEPNQFEDLVVKICIRWLGEGIAAFAIGKDGGQDARFDGTALEFPSSQKPLSGKFVIQAKHSSNPTASCSDPTFEHLLEDEHPRIKKLILDGELDHYLLFTNRKLTGIQDGKLRRKLKALGLKTAHIVGNEMLRQRLDLQPSLLDSIGFSLIDPPFRFQPSDLVDVVKMFRASVPSVKSDFDSAHNFNFVEHVRKNKVNGLSKTYYESYIVRDSMPHFTEIKDFLENPRNRNLADLYHDAANELKQAIITNRKKFGAFDEVLTFIYEQIIAAQPALRGKKRYVTLFLHYMYCDCDIGDHG